jgi:hypothetical protein
MKLDNFALSLFQSCPAMYNLRIEQGWVPVRKHAALGFGGAIHIALAAWHRTYNAKAAIRAMLEKWPDGMPEEDFRTKEKAISVMLEYFQTYPQENFKVVGAPDSALIERAFTIDTGLFLECGACQMYSTSNRVTDNVCFSCGQLLEPLEYGGILDAGILFYDKVYTLEHKTTTRMGDSYFLQFKPNNQVTGYIWGLSKLTNTQVGGCMVNAIGIYKSQATKFERHLTTRTQAEIDEWLLNVLATANDIARCKRTGIWPMRTMACTMFGLCDFHNVHVLANPKEREKRLEADYRCNKWDYEHRDEGDAT